jgi:hypothetical protein
MFMPVVAAERVAVAGARVILDDAGRVGPRRVLRVCACVVNGNAAVSVMRTKLLKSK